jgi:hypothetical protein
MRRAELLLAGCLLDPSMTDLGDGTFLNPIVPVDRAIRPCRWQPHRHNVAYDFLSLRLALYVAGRGAAVFREMRYEALEDSTRS